MDVISRRPISSGEADRTLRTFLEAAKENNVPSTAFYQLVELQKAIHASVSFTTTPVRSDSGRASQTHQRQAQQEQTGTQDADNDADKAARKAKTKKDKSKSKSKSGSAM